MNGLSPFATPFSGVVEVFVHGAGFAALGAGKRKCGRGGGFLVSIGTRRCRGPGQGELLRDEMLRLVDRELWASDELVRSWTGDVERSKSDSFEE